MKYLSKVWRVLDQGAIVLVQALALLLAFAFIILLFEGLKWMLT